MFETDYTQTPAHKLVPTRCAVCGRALTDAVSLESGIGPICSKNYYTDAPEVDDAVMGRVGAALLGVEDVGIRQKVGDAVEDRNSQKAANILVYHIAMYQKDAKSLPLIRALRGLGFEVLASKIEERFKPSIEIELKEGRLIISSPFNAGFVKTIKTIKGRKFDWDTKRWSVPADQKAPLWKALIENFEGEMGVGPKGPFQI